MLAHAVLRCAALCHNALFTMRCAVQATMLVSLLQPAPETFDLFDDVMVRPLMTKFTYEGEGTADVPCCNLAAAWGFGLWGAAAPRFPWPRARKAALWSHLLAISGASLRCTAPSTILSALLARAPSLPSHTYLLAAPLQVISSGKLVFQGPREFVLPFFEGLGFGCPKMKGTADFLQVSASGSSLCVE